jgi:hypothetical protein
MFEPFSRLSYAALQDVVAQDHAGSFTRRKRFREPQGVGDPSLASRVRETQLLQTDILPVS